MPEDKDERAALIGFVVGEALLGLLLLVVLGAAVFGD